MTRTSQQRLLRLVARLAGLPADWEVQGELESAAGLLLLLACRLLWLAAAAACRCLALGQLLQWFELKLLLCSWCSLRAHRLVGSAVVWVITCTKLKATTDLAAEVWLVASQGSSSRPAWWLPAELWWC